MRRLSLIPMLLLVLTVMSGCTKNSDIGPGLTGKYRLSSVTGGWSGAEYRFTLDSIIILRLNADSSFSNTLKGKVASQGHYGLRIMVDPNFTDTLISFVSNGDTMITPLRRPDIRHLNLGNGIADGLTSIYQKIGN